MCRPHLCSPKLTDDLSLFALARLWTVRTLVVALAAATLGCSPNEFDRLARKQVDASESGESPDTGAQSLDSATQEPVVDAASERDAAATIDAGAAEDSETPRLDGSPESGPLEGGAEVDARPLPTCPAPRAICDGTCVDLSGDRAHCGGCGKPCDPGQECFDRQCRSETGCSDKTREGFYDVLAFPDIAGCAAVWPLASLRAASTQTPCGNSVGPCSVPADACARGWHVCGNAASGPADVTARVTSGECNYAPGRWAIALGDFSCEVCDSVPAAGAVCCGASCVQQNRDCLWPGMTAWFGTVNGVLNACSGTVNPQLSLNVGVLCCRDGAPAAN